MTNKPKAIGTAAETAVVKYLQGRGIACQRLALHGNKDIGDLRLGNGHTAFAEVKAHKVVTDGLLADWQKQTDTEQANGHWSIGLLIVKRPGKGFPGAWMCWRKNRYGYWYMQWLDAAIDMLELEGHI